MTDHRKVQDTYLAPAEKALTEDALFGLTYEKDLAQVSPTDTITGSSWVVEGGGLTVEASSFDDNTTSVRLSGGTKIGELHRVTNTVTTSNGQTLVRVLTVKIMNIHVKRPEESDVEFTTPAAPSF